jgi:hypothetical protein
MVLPPLKDGWNVSCSSEHWQLQLAPRRIPTIKSLSMLWVRFPPVLVSEVTDDVEAQAWRLILLLFLKLRTFFHEETRAIEQSRSGHELA